MPPATPDAGPSVPEQNPAASGSAEVINPMTTDGTRAEIGRALSLPPDRAILDVPVVFARDGKRLDVENVNGAQRVRVNVARFPTAEEAVRAAAIRASSVKALRDELKNDAKGFLDAVRQFPASAQAVLRLKGLRQLVLWEEGTAGVIGQTPPASLTLRDQFDVACEQFLLTGKVPDGLQDAVRDALAKLSPRPDINALAVVSDERRIFRNAIALYEKYVAPVRAELSKSDAEQRKTERDEYVPPPFSGEQEPVDPASVEFRVSPYLGGYYRGQIFRYDPALLRLVAQETTTMPFVPEDLPEDVDTLPRYTFSGVFRASKECILPLPQRALPLPTTLAPAGFRIMRSARGTFSLECTDAVPPSAPAPFSFSFVLAETSDNRIDDEPIEVDTVPFGGPLDEKAKEMLTRIQSSQFLGPLDPARAIASFAKKNLRYPEDDEMPAMNARYAQAGPALLQAIATDAVADCHWSNIYASGVGHAAGIPWRVPTGYFVTKHPDCDDALIGGTGHAWSEVWDAGARAWARMDATPAKKNDDEEADEDMEPEGDTPPADAMELDEEQLKKLARELRDVSPSPQAVTDALFRARTNVSRKDWQRVEEFIRAVNRSTVEQGAQIPETAALLANIGDKLKSPRGTLAREWEKLFSLICKRRTIQRKAFRGPVAQSEGVRLRDSVEAYIDIMADNTDPGGFEIDAVKKKTIVDVRAFEEDAVIDLTSSMDTMDDYGNVMRIEQKKMILSLLYHLMKLNERLADSRVRSTLRESLTIKSEIFSIHGGGDPNAGQYACLKARDEMVTEQVLVHLARELDRTTPGTGDLLSALKKYREGITAEIARRLKSGEFVKLLTIYSDGNMWCSACGKEDCQVEMHRERIGAIVNEVKAIRELGVIVQGIGFTESARSIEVICKDPEDPMSAIIVDDVSKAVSARHAMLARHLQKI